jgi:hypothetical protein
VPIWKAALFALVGFGVGLVVLGIFNPDRGAVQVTATPSGVTTGDEIVGVEAATPLNLPDQSTPVAPELFQAQFPQGVLQITAIEDNSQRATDIRERALLTPITGARFYALKLIFECRQGICANPPQARLSLQMNDGVEIPMMDNVGITGERLFQPLAQGRSTTGWSVFEIPAESNPARLIIMPATTEATETPEPVFIDLSAS